MAEIVTPPTMSFCPACGTAVGREDQFCKGCGKKLSGSNSDCNPGDRRPSSWETNKGTNPWPIVLGVVGGIFVLLIIFGALTDQSEEDARTTATPTAAPDWRTFMDDRDVTLLSKGIVQLGLRHDILLDEYKVRRSIAQGMTEELANESRIEQIWLWLRAIVGAYDEHDVANELEQSIVILGLDVSVALEPYTQCCAANP